MSDFDIDSLLEKSIGTEKVSENKTSNSDGYSESVLIEKVKKQGNVHEAIRDIVYTSTKDENFGLIGKEEAERLEKSQEEKQKELYEILDNLDQELEGKSTKEVAAVFTSLMEIQSQLCAQKTDGVITVRTMLKNFFNIENQEEIKKYNFQEITLIFTPEEVSAVRRRMDKIQDDHPLFAFFTTIIDQAQDVVQYNEMSGRLLIQLTKYFLSKLSLEGYGKSNQTIDFKERHKRSTSSFERVLSELRADERIILQHLKNYPVLTKLPRRLRKLIYIKLGIYDPSELREAISFTRNNLGKYNRARNVVQMDFSRFFSQQKNILLRQKLILKLHQDILKYTGEVFEDELKNCMGELKTLVDEIESNIEELDPNSPEYEDLLRKKASIQRKVEERRKKLDVVKSQEHLIDVQHQMVSGALERFEQNEVTNNRIDEQLAKLKQTNKIVQNKPMTAKKKNVNRMVMSKTRKKD